MPDSAARPLAVPQSRTGSALNNQTTIDVDRSCPKDTQLPSRLTMYVAGGGDKRAWSDGIFQGPRRFGWGLGVMRNQPRQPKARPSNRLATQLGVVTSRNRSGAASVSRATNGSLVSGLPDAVHLGKRPLSGNSVAREGPGEGPESTHQRQAEPRRRKAGVL
jgi:hypothetical protein